MTNRYSHKSHFASAPMSSSVQFPPSPKQKTAYYITHKATSLANYPQGQEKRVSKTQLIPLLLIWCHSRFFIGPFANALPHFHPFDISSISSSTIKVGQTQTVLQPWGTIGIWKWCLLGGLAVNKDYTHNRRKNTHLLYWMLSIEKYTFWITILFI